jgi:hypothetical protein
MPRRAAPGKVPVRHPCPCPRCVGALISEHTIQSHASHVVDSPSNSIIPFSVWASIHLPASQQPPSPDGSELDSANPTDGNDTCSVPQAPGNTIGHGDNGRPSKRPRSMGQAIAVRF